jgi:Holliday junction resolvasome RuvABC endonuclease subunit
MIYIGIDPGVSGGLAILEADGSIVDVFAMPGTERDLLDAFNPFAAPDLGPCPASAPRAHAMLERVYSSPQMGVASAFTFGKGYGALLMALTAARIPFNQVVPAKWQQVMGCRSRGDKNVTKQRAQQLFPDTKITHAIADALLLAEYGRRLEVAVPPESLLEMVR